MTDQHQVRVVRQHDETDLDYHEMVLIGRRESSGRWVEHEKRDSIGRLNAKGGVRWHIAICNNPDCSAEMVVQLDEIIKQIASDAYLDPKEQA